VSQEAQVQVEGGGVSYRYCRGTVDAYLFLFILIKCAASAFVGSICSIVTLFCRIEDPGSAELDCTWQLAINDAQFCRY
jgi:hypothetical protein